MVSVVGKVQILLSKSPSCVGGPVCRWLSVSAAHRKDEKRAKYFPAKIEPMLPPGAFDGKVAFITGGGTGLGKGMARMLSQLGAQVTIVSRRLEVLQKTADEISAETGNKVLAVSADVRNPLAVREAVDACLDQQGLPNIIINNAAGNFISPTERLSSNAWKAVVDIVLNGTANVTLDIGKRLIAAKQGAAFLAITTTYTQSGSGFVAPSAAAKAGVETLTKSLASEWSKYGMRFNCIAPGPIETKGLLLQTDPRAIRRAELPPRIPIGRLGEKQEFCNLACYLVSDYATWLTGEIVRFDGGEYNFMAGEFNDLQKVAKEEWDMLENMIRKKSDS